MPGFGVHEDGGSAGSVFASLYVDSSNPIPGNGSSINPFNTLDAALNYLSASSLSGYTIKMAGGTYTTALSFDGANSLYCEPNVIINYTGTSYLFNLVNQSIIFIVYGFGKFRTSSGAILNSSNSNASIICAEMRCDTVAVNLPCVSADTFRGGFNITIDMQGGNLLSQNNHCISMTGGARISVINATINAGYGSNLNVRALYCETAGINASYFQNCILATSVNNTAIVEFSGVQYFFKFNNCTFTLQSNNTCREAILFSNGCSFAQNLLIENVNIEAIAGTFTYSMAATAALSIELKSISTILEVDPAFAISNSIPEYKIYKSALLAVPLNGALEFDGTNYYLTIGGTRYTFATTDYVNNIVTGLLDLRGGYDPTVTSLWPVTGGSGTAGAVLKGDTWYITVAGTINGLPVKVGDVIFAKINTPAQVNANWELLNYELGYIAEDVANKDTSIALAANSNTKYPSQAAAKSYMDNSCGFLSNITSITGAAGTDVSINAASALDRIPTLGVAPQVAQIGRIVIFQIAGVQYQYRLRAGTDAEASPQIIRPNDYNGATNQQIWEFISGNIAKTYVVDAVAVVNTGSTTENTVKTYTIPAKEILSTGRVTVTFYYTTTGAGLKTAKIKVNGNIASTSGAAATGNSISAAVANLGVLNSQMVQGTSILPFTIAVDHSTTDFTITITMQNVVAGDTATVLYVIITKAF